MERILGLTVAFLALFTAVAAGQETPPTPGPPPLPSFVTDGPVNALTTANGRLYVGGSFSRIGPQTGGLAGVTGATGERQARIPPVGGAVFSEISDGAGGYFIGGAFSVVGGVPRANLAHIRADGSVDPAFAPDPDDLVLGMVIIGNRLFIGGNFVHVGTEIRRRLAAVDVSSGALDTSFTVPVDGAVRSLAASGTRLFVGGDFKGIDGTSRRGIAVVDTVAGALDKGFDVTPDGPIRAVHVFGDRLYVGGAFTEISGRSRSGLAAFDVETGELDDTFAPSVNGTVWVITDNGSRLFVGGGFTEIAQTFDNGVASLNPTTGRASDDFRFFAQGTVYGLSVNNGRVYAGGDFNQVNGQPAPRMVAADASTGAIDGGFFPDPNGDVYAVLAQGDEVLTGGVFSSMPRRSAGNLAVLDAGSGVADPAFGAVVDGPVKALAADGNTLYVGGSFAHVNTVAKTNLAAVDTGSGRLTDFAGPAPVAINALAVAGGHLYAAGSGDFVIGRRESHPGLIRYTNGGVDRAFNRFIPPYKKDTVGTPGLLASGAGVNTLLVNGSFLYTGGNFFTPDKKKPFVPARNARRSLLALDAGSGKLIPRFDPKVTGSVNGLAVSPEGTLFAIGAGDLQKASGYHYFKPPKGKRQKITDYQYGLIGMDAGSGTISPTFRADLRENGTSVAVAGGQVYAGGAFGTLDGRRIDNLGSVSAVDGKLIPGYTPEPSGGSFDPFSAPSSAVSTMLIAGGRLYVGGAFRTLGTYPQGYLAALPPTVPQ